MLLRRLTLHNFGTYKGSQTFDLTVQGARNVVLIGGKNGAGKSTFLESIRLCLYGSAAFRTSLSRERYDKYLLDRIHRDPSVTAPSKAAAVEIEFDHSDESGTARYRIVREWFRVSNSSVREAVSLKRDGELVGDIDSLHWQDFIQELLPLGVSDLFFFDGEKVQLLADDGSDASTLAEAISNLLGANIVERLNADLSIYLFRGMQKADAGTASVQEMQSLLETLGILQHERRGVEVELLTATAESDHITAQLEAQEQELQRQGGNYARNKGRLDERSKQINSRVENLESSLREYATGLLPIALAPNLLQQVLKQLEIEQDVRFGVVVDESLARAAKATLVALKRFEIGSGARAYKLGTIANFKEIEKLIRTSHAGLAFDAPMIHDLSGLQEKQIQGWGSICLSSLPKELRSIGEQLEELYRERQKVERDIQRIPQEEILKPLLEKLQEARERFSKQAEELAQLRIVMEALDQKIQRADAEYRRSAETAKSASSQRVALERAGKAQDVLREFREALIEQKVRAVEKELTYCFGLLSRKKVKRLFSIDALSFAVSLRDERGRSTPKSELSAGEKQIYAIAVLWSLGRVAKSPAPIIIDTPLARLDSEHRALLIKHYFPKVSHQVIILSTDTEIDEASMESLKPAISRSFELDFDPNEQATSVKAGYFQSKDACEPS